LAAAQPGAACDHFRVDNHGEQPARRVVPEALEVVDNPGETRYEARLEGRLVAITEYELGGGTLNFVHTEVLPDFEGQGVGSRLAAGALRDVRARGLKVRADCPFMSSYLRRHREFDDLLAG
jgi:predicted GNAT family acetyltransferase